MRRLESRINSYPQFKTEIDGIGIHFLHIRSRYPKAWAEKTFSKLVYWNRATKGDHFAAFEQPKLFVEELRAGFAPMRSL